MKTTLIIEKKGQRVEPYLTEAERKQVYSFLVALESEEKKEKRESEVRTEIDRVEQLGFNPRVEEVVFINMNYRYGTHDYVTLTRKTCILWPHNDSYFQSEIDSGSSWGRIFYGSNESAQAMARAKEIEDILNRALSINDMKEKIKSLESEVNELKENQEEEEEEEEQVN